MASCILTPTPNQIDNDEDLTAAIAGAGEHMEFLGCPDFTLGVEWELQLLEKSSLNLHPGVEPVLQSFTGHPHIVPEFFQSCVELNTPVSPDSAAVQAHLLSLTREVSQHCQTLGMTLAGAGTHPFCRRLARVTPSPRYSQLAVEHGYIGRTMMTFANHVHVGMPSGNEAIRVMRYLTPCLPLLLAISANSPFWRGHLTGYAAYRRRLLAATRSYGIPPYFDDWAAFQAFFAMATRSRAIHTLKDVHWDIRPHPDFGTLEIRVMDAQSTVADVAFLAGLVRVMVAWITSSSAEAIEEVVPRRLTTWIDRENHFRASHWGMQAALICDESGATIPVIEYLRRLTGAITGTASDLDETRLLDELQQLSVRESGYQRQINAYRQREKLADVVATLRDRLLDELNLQNAQPVFTHRDSA